MTKEMFTLSFGFAALIAATNMADAQTGCADRPTVVERPAEDYGESRQAVALAANDEVVEVFASREAGTRTITVTRPGGPTCLVASGHAYEAVADSLPVPGKGA